MLAEFFLGCQCLLLWRWRWHDPLPIAIPCVALITSILALNVTIPIGMMSTYVVLVTLALLLPTALVVTKPAGSPTGHKTVPWSARFVVLLVWASALLGTWGMTEAWSRWLPDAQTWFAAQVGRSERRRHQFRNYVTSGSLTAISAESTFNPNAIALRVYGDTQPGYLAGRVFSQYRNGQWSIDSKRDPNRYIPGGADLRGVHYLVPLEHVPDAMATLTRDISTFELPHRAPATILKRWTIENDPRRGEVFFTALGWRYVQGEGTRLAVDEFDIVRSGLSVRTPYVIHVDTSGPMRPLSKSLRRRMLIPPSGLDPRITRLARAVCRDAKTTRDRIQAIRAYFQDNYEYSLDPVKTPRGVDPLNHFLLARHPAHCEFFASGAVALLRLQGIPARYVTGYGVLQFDKVHGKRWLARNRDAHAWAEAYDDATERWVVVEATPGFTDPSLIDESDTEQAGGGGGDSGISLANDAGALLQWWRELPTLVRYALVAILLFCGALVGFVFVRRTRWDRTSQEYDYSDPRARAWRRVLRRMDHRLKRRGVVRGQSETMHQFAHRLHALAGIQDTQLRTSAHWYVAYADRRFRAAAGAPPPLPPKRTR